MLLYVLDTAEKREKDISASNAIISLSVPSHGQITEIGVPFMTEEEASTADVPLNNNWAALCLWVEPNAESGIE